MRGLDKDCDSTIDIQEFASRFAPVFTRLNMKQDVSAYSKRNKACTRKLHGWVCKWCKYTLRFSHISLDCSNNQFQNISVLRNFTHDFSNGVGNSAVSCAPQPICYDAGLRNILREACKAHNLL